MAYIFGSIWDRFNRNALNNLSKSVEQQGKSIQDLVAEGQLTPAQYADLITVINGNISKGGVSIYDINKNLGKFDSTYFSSDFLTELNNGDIVATEVLPDSITDEELARGAVTPDKTTFTEVASNKFNKDGVVRGRYLNEGDGVILSEDNSHSGYIYFPNVNKMTVSRVSRINFYDGSQTVISSHVPTSMVSETVTVPSGTVFIRVNVAIGNLDNAQINIGSTLLPYEPYTAKLKDEVSFNVTSNKIENGAVSPIHTDFLKTSTNLFNKHNIINGAYLNAADAVIESNVHSYSDYIDVSMISNLTFTKVARVNMYDKDGTPFTSTAYDPLNTETISVPSNAYSIRVNIVTSDLESVQINEGTTLLDYEPFYYDFIYKNNIIPSDDLRINSNIVTANNYFNATESAPSGFTTYSLNDLYARYEELRVAFPDYISRQVIKNDLDGNPIYRYDFKPKSVDPLDEKYKKIFITTGTHGGEKASIWTTYLMFKNLCENWLGDEVLEDLRTNVHFVLIPVVNPFSYNEFVNGVSIGRTNKNGVDILRNFPNPWKNARVADLDSSARTYRGIAPLSELEAQAVYEVYQEGGWNYVTDFHNFFTPEKDNYFIWIPGTDDYTQRLAKNYIRKMSIKWKKEKEYFPKDPDIHLGYSDINNLGIYDEAFHDGIPSSLTEICQKVMLEPVVSSYSGDAISMGTEAITNWMYHVYLNV